MPDYPKPPGQWLSNHLKGTQAQAIAANTSGTTYIVDPAIPVATPGTATSTTSVPPLAAGQSYNCRAIIGNVSVDNFGNATGLPASGRSSWGIAVYNTTSKTWSQL